jgi:hypothetical protein
MNFIQLLDLLGGAYYTIFPSSLSPLERKLLYVVVDALPGSLRATFTEQIRLINVIQHGGGCQKIRFFKVHCCRDHPDMLPPMSIKSETLKLCSIAFRVPGQERLRHAVVSAREQRLYEINFDTWANDIIRRSDIEIIRVKPIAPRHLLIPVPRRRAAKTSDAPPRQGP